MTLDPAAVERVADALWEVEGRPLPESWSSAAELAVLYPDSLTARTVNRYRTMARAALTAAQSAETTGYVQDLSEPRPAQATGEWDEAMGRAFGEPVANVTRQVDPLSTPAVVESLRSEPVANGTGQAHTSLRLANIARQAAWTGGETVSSLFRATELAGEVGEACNVVKKLERERSGWRGSRATVDDLAAELADVVICADLLALAEGIDLDAAVAAKFNATSEKVGLPQRLRPTSEGGGNGG